ncbi:MAG: hypothetical protein ISP01_08685 [Methanobrevibacter arboriphilus]|uniref:Uncharacterized protein n=1 Tax=Methanobrevibacter arboriphilus TaxID=39441 RepID=A0A843AHT6_METAZ|nr:hypothetical protein [Methanobrevibacter arboriphilus]MBF4469463.1 hypothetical protein [Methanobrevibacter arboriphilus]
MAQLPYRKKEFQVHNTRDYCEVNQKHDEDKPPRTFAEELTGTIKNSDGGFL